MSAHSSSLGDFTAGKRARFWLGDKADNFIASGCEKDENVPTIDFPGDDEVDADIAPGPSDFSSHDFTESDDDEIEMLYRTKSGVRHVSEDIMESMEV